jgi:hypothetical protein
MGEKSGSGSGMNNSNHISESLETIFLVKILKFFDADPGWQKFGSGINIPDPQHCYNQSKMCTFKQNCSRYLQFHLTAFFTNLSPEFIPVLLAD